MDIRREDVARAWAEQVRASQEQVERLGETGEPADLYAPWARRFALDPRRTDDPAVNALLAIARSDETWLDIGAGGGRYALPLALHVRRVVAVEPSASMVAVLREGLAEHAIDEVEVIAAAWPVDRKVDADVALLAHVGYDIPEFGTFLDAAEAVVRRVVVIMRTSGAARIDEVLWPHIHGEARRAYPMLPELRELLAARGVEPEVSLIERGSWGYDSREQLLAAARTLLHLRHGSAKDRRLEQLVAERATERDGSWAIAWTPMQDGVVSWEVPA
ncbi:MAG: methyltransferase domain-containing protein [Candidatus Limnocylindrales bacterium]